MPKAQFSHVTTWVFDLDNTLYCPSVRLFDQIEKRMTQFVMDTLHIPHAEADALRVAYWREHGTTLAGLMAEHALDPGPFLHAVHDISFDALSPDPALRARLADLPGRRIVYTNGTAPYAERVIAARGLSGLFDAVYGVEHANYAPKPRRAAFERVFEADGFDPLRGAMSEDEARNLEIPHQMGLRTVHVASKPDTAGHIHLHTDDLSGFLAKLL